MLAMSDSLKRGGLNASFGFSNITKKKIKHYTPPIAATLHNNPQKQFVMQARESMPLFVSFIVDSFVCFLCPCHL
jgi:hypothetical protein